MLEFDKVDTVVNYEKGTIDREVLELQEFKESDEFKARIKSDAYDYDAVMGDIVGVAGGEEM